MERSGKAGEGIMAQWFNPKEQTQEGLLLKEVEALLKEVKNKKKADLDKDGKLSGYEKKRAKAIESSMAKQGYKSDRGNRPAPELPTPKGDKNKIGKADMSEKNKYCQKHFGCNYSECTPKQKAQCDKVHGKPNNDSKIDKTTEILMEMGIIKAQQEPSVSDSYPEFYNVDGGEKVRARGYTTQGMFPDWNDGPKKSIVSENADMFAFAKTGYGADGTGLHMHYNDKGGTRATPNVDSIEQKLGQLTKQFGGSNQGIIGEIENLLKQVRKELDKSNDKNMDCDVCNSRDGCPSCK